MNVNFAQDVQFLFNFMYSLSQRSLQNEIMLINIYVELRPNFCIYWIWQFVVNLKNFPQNSLITNDKIMRRKTIKQQTNIDFQTIHFDFYLKLWSRIIILSTHWDPTIHTENFEQNQIRSHKKKPFFFLCQL